MMWHECWAPLPFCTIVKTKEDGLQDKLSALIAILSVNILTKCLGIVEAFAAATSKETC